MRHHNEAGSHAPHRVEQRNRILALAAMVQVAYLVQGIARRGTADAVEAETCIGGLFADSGKSVEEIFGSAERLRTGMIVLTSLLQGSEVGRAKELVKYVAGMISLEKKLARNPAMLQKIATEMERIERQANYFDSIMHDNIIAAIADLYGESVSTLKPRIIVLGRNTFLQQSANTNRVRALLLSGIRAAHLWRKNGGRHLQLILRRRSLADQAQALLREVSRI
jgi:high frequency lysogenization protein